MIDGNIWGAFQGIGLSFHDMGHVQRLCFDVLTLRESRAFQELWIVNYSPENFAARRRNLEFGWINKPE
jgi:hypothetical protein